MGLAGYRHVVIRKPIDITGHFLRPDNDEDFIVRPYIADHFRQVEPVHGQVDDNPARRLPLLDAGTPLHVVLAEKLPAPAHDNIRDALDNALIRCRKEHPFRAKGTGSKPNVGGHPLVAFRAVADPENGYFFSWHGVFFFSLITLFSMVNGRSFSYFSWLRMRASPNERRRTERPLRSIMQDSSRRVRDASTSGIPRLQSAARTSAVTDAPSGIR